MSLDFMIDRFGSSGSYAACWDDFTTSEGIWRAARVDTLLMCVISFLYMLIYMGYLDVGVVMVVKAQHILAETYISASYCHVFGDREFWGSSTLL